MKNIIAIFIIFSAFSCSKKSLYVLEKNQPIVDLPTNPQFYHSKNALNSALEKQNRETIYLWNEQSITKGEFQEMMKKNNTVKTFDVIKDSTAIEKMGYSFKEIKNVIILK